jgi:hypothetical protein
VASADVYDIFIIAARSDGFAAAELNGWRVSRIGGGGG